MVNSGWHFMVWGNSVGQWLTMLSVIAGIWLGAWGMRVLLIRRFQRSAMKTKNTLDDLVVAILQQSVMPFIYVLSVYIGINYLYVYPRLKKILQVAMLAVSVFLIIRFVRAWSLIF